MTERRGRDWGGMSAFGLALALSVVIAVVVPIVPAFGPFIGWGPAQSGWLALLIGGVAFLAIALLCTAFAHIMNGGKK